MEFMNVVKSLNGKQPIYNNNAKNTSVSIIKFKKKMVKTKQGNKEKLSAVVTLENDNSHLTKKKEIISEIKPKEKA